MTEETIKLDNGEEITIVTKFIDSPRRDEPAYLQQPSPPPPPPTADQIRMNKYRRACQKFCNQPMEPLLTE